MEPTHARMDPLGLIVRHLDAVVDHAVIAGADAALNPLDGPVTVVQVTRNVPVDPWGTRRWAFNVSVTLITYAETITSAVTTHAEAADATLALTRLDSGTVRVSTVRATQEPEDVPVRSATDWPGQLSSYTFTLRRED